MDHAVGRRQHLGQGRYGSPAANGGDTNVIVFRAVDTAGNMIGGPVRLTATAG